MKREIEAFIEGNEVGHGHTEIRSKRPTFGRPKTRRLDARAGRAGRCDFSRCAVAALRS